MTDTQATGHGRPVLRTLFVVAQSELSPGSRYRVYQYLPHLREAGIDGHVVAMQDQGSTERSVNSPLFHPLRRVAHYAFTWVESFIVQLRLVALAPRFDRIVLYRLPLWAVTRWLLAPRRARIITDFDDALDEIDHSAEERLGGLKRWILGRGLQNAILASTTTITSNAHNCGVVERLSRRAAIIPTSIDMTRLPFRDRSASLEERLVVGWMGTPSTARYLAAIEDALRDVSRQRPIVIRLIGAGRNPFRALDAEIVEWSFAGEPDALARIDIGLMPMPDTAWTRGKAATKALQYNASGAPAVSSRTATNLAILGESAGSLFASTTDEWIAALIRLIDDPAFRAEIGRRGHARVRESFSVQANAPRLAGLIRDPAGASVGRD
jgi:glycosyltransferase involved in cell wall biosynthesis